MYELLSSICKSNLLGVVTKVNLYLSVVEPVYLHLIIMLTLGPPYGKVTYVVFASLK